MQSRAVSIFLLAFGVWSWLIWGTFAVNLWTGDDAWAADGSPTAFFFMHAALTVTSIILGTIIGVIGWRGLRARAARERAERDGDGRDGDGRDGTGTDPSPARAAAAAPQR